MLWRRLAAEYLGSAFLALIVIGSGIAAQQLSPGATGLELLQNALVDNGYVAKLLPLLPSGDSELYSHPSPDQFKNELDALVNPSTRALVRQLGIQLIRYEDL